MKKLSAPDPYMEVYVCHLRYHRRVAGFSQAELAELAQISRQTVALIESGKIIPSVKIATSIARVFSLPIEDIFVFTHAEDTRAIAMRNLARFNAKGGVK